MADTKTDPTEDAPFRLSSLVGASGVGSNGEMLVNTLLDHYPPELQAAQLKRINPELDSKLKDEDRKKVAKIIGVDEVEHVHVRGGESRAGEAVVTYAHVDEKGTVWKGYFPYSDLSKGSSDEHVSQRESVSHSEAARQSERAKKSSARKSSRSRSSSGDDS